MRRIRRGIPVALLAVFAFASCADPAPQESRSGVSATAVQVKTGPDGLTNEQRNVGKRLTEDNKPGAIKHLYVISPYSGQVLIYSTVQGKVTSGGKRLSPRTVVVGAQGDYKRNGIEVSLGSRHLTTAEVLEDDGTYGESAPYLFWWDVRGVYHQHYVGGGAIVHVSEKPIPVRGVVINLEVSTAPEPAK